MLCCWQSADAYVTSTLSTFAGVASSTGAFGGDGGAATSASFDTPNSIWADSQGSVFVTDNGNYRIRKIVGGMISTVYGAGSATQSGDDGKATSAGGACQFVTGDTAGVLYFSDDEVVRTVDLSTGIVTWYAGDNSGSNSDGAPATSAYLNLPKGMAVDTVGNVYIASLKSDKVYKISAGTKTLSDVAGTGVGEMDDPNVSVDAYYVDPSKDGDNGYATSANIVRPYTLFLNTVNELYISEQDGKALRMVNLDTGIISLVAGTGHYGYSGDGGLATEALLDDTMCISGDSDNNLFISSSTTNVVRYVEDNEQFIDAFAGKQLLLEACVVVYLRSSVQVVDLLMVMVDLALMVSSCHQRVCLHRVV